MEKWYVVDDGEIYNVLPEEEFDPEFYDRSQVIKITNNMDAAFRIADKLNRAVEEKMNNFSPMKGYYNESTSVKLTDDKLYSIIAESIKRKLNEGVEDTFWGCPSIKVRWHGEWSDPEVMYDGYLANYFEIENTLVRLAQQEGIDTDEDDEAFAQFCQQHESDIQELIVDNGEKEENPFDMTENKMEKEVRLTENQLHNMIAESIMKNIRKKHLTEGSTNQKVLDVWDEMVESVGPQAFLDMIYSALGHDQLVDLLKYFNRVYEFGIDLTDIERM